MTEATQGGTVFSGLIDKNKEYTVVEFPGRVNNVGRAVEMLGGESKLAAAVQTEAEVLPCRPRTNDLLSRPIEGTLTDARMLLLRVMRKRTDPTQVKAEVLGMVRKKYTFAGLADFQTTAPAESNVVESMLRIPEGFEEAMLDARVPPHLPLPQYTQHAQPMDYGYRPSHADRKNKGAAKPTLLLQGRRRRLPREGNRVLFEDDTPNGPMTILPALTEPVSRALDRLTELFQIRPIWSKRAVMNSVPSHMHDYIRAALPHVAYFMRSGPWRALWVRYGYDPRKNPEAKMYQMVFLRIDPSFYLEYLAALPPQFRDMARPIGASEAPLARRRRPKKRAGPLAQLAVVAKNQPEIDEATRQLEHIFRRENPPTLQQGSYQICDLHEVELQDLVNLGTTEECSAEDGWCLPGTLTAIRERIAAILRDIASKPHQKDGARDASTDQSKEATVTSLAISNALPPLGDIGQWLGSEDDMDDEAMFGSDSDEDNTEESDLESESDGEQAI